MRALAAALCCVGLAGDRVAGACGRHSPPVVLPQAGVSSSRISVICLRLLKSSTSLPLSGHWGGVSSWGAGSHSLALGSLSHRF